MWYLKIGLFIGALTSLFIIVAPLVSKKIRTLISNYAEDSLWEDLFDMMHDIATGEDFNFKDTFIISIYYLIFSFVVIICCLLFGLVFGLPVLLVTIISAPIYFILKERNRKK